MKKLGFGMMRLPLIDEKDNTSIDIARTKEMTDAFLANGFTYFDTAAPYHGKQSEVAVREAVVKHYPRENYTITDKLSLFMIDKKEDMPQFFDDQLERLGTDYIDIYLLHALGKDAYQKAKDFEAFEFAFQKKAEGKIKHVGFSFHDTAEVLDMILTEQPNVEYVQLQINYLDWEDENVQSRKCYEVAVKHGKKILIMEPVKGGALAKVNSEVEKRFKAYAPNASIASWAVRFCASLEHVVMVLSGMSTEEQVADNLSYMKDFVPMNEEEMKLVLDAAETIRNDIAIACTGCRYCVDDCPMQIAIPEYFKIYNRHKQLQGTQTGMDKNRYTKASDGHGKASACVECGLCEGHCPQNLPIRKLLKDVVNALE